MHVLKALAWFLHPGRPTANLHLDLKIWRGLKSLVTDSVLSEAVSKYRQRADA